MAFTALSLQEALLAIEQLKHFLESRPKKKILHFGSLAGWPYTLARLGRTFGLQTENVIHQYKDVFDLDRALPFDREIFHAHDAWHQRIQKNFSFLWRAPKEYALIHYHGGNIGWRELFACFEGPWMRYHRVPTILSFGGGDARFDRSASALNPYYYRTPKCSREFSRWIRWQSWRPWITYFASDPEFINIAKDFVDASRLRQFRQPIDLLFFDPVFPDASLQKPKILHVPTEPQVKGTEAIVRAVERLKARGLSFDFEMHRQLTQDAFFNVLKGCDLYVDELRCGTYGMTAVEAMAFGKPVISWMREDLRSEFPSECPTLSANPDTIESVLGMLIEQPQDLHHLGKASRSYVERYHDARIVLGECAMMYLEALQACS